VVVDIGTGDGRAVLVRAKAEPGALVVGIDAVAGLMREASNRAHRRGPANARFIAVAAEALPGPLAGTADLVTVTMPWGSLLRGALGRDAAVMRGIAGLLSGDGGARVEILLSVTPKDGIQGLATLDATAAPALAEAWCLVGLRLDAMRPATRADLVATGSTWAKRLGERPVWRITLRR
jgi:16S rRNA (adenine(1408)-N(1))-methyltransferase